MSSLLCIASTRIHVPLAKYKNTHKERGSESIQFSTLTFSLDILFRSLHHWTSVCVCMWARARELLTDALCGVTDMLHCRYHLVGWLELKAGRWPLWNDWLKWRLGDLSLLKTAKEAKGREDGGCLTLFRQGHMTRIKQRKLNKYIFGKIAIHL